MDELLFRNGRFEYNVMLWENKLKNKKLELAIRFIDIEECLEM